MTTLPKTHERTTGAKLWPAAVTALSITLVGGVLYGGYAQRWSPPAELSAGVIRLEKLPNQVGKWKAVENLPIDAEAVQMLDCAGYNSRRYVNQETGQQLNCAVLVGRAGPIAVHTPEVCFSSRAYDITGERTETGVEENPSRRHSFWLVDFSSRNALADALRVYYAWSSGDAWIASRSPRFEFAGAPLLYKIQLAVKVSPNVASKGDDPGKQFLEEFVRSAWQHNAGSENVRQKDGHP